MRNAIRLPMWISLSAVMAVFLAVVAMSCGGSSATSTPPPTERPTCGASNRNAPSHG